MSPSPPSRTDTPPPAAPPFADPAAIAKAAAAARPQKQPRPAAPPPPPPPATAASAAKPGVVRSLGDYYKDWEQRTRTMHEEAAKVDWSAVDMSKLKASDIGVRLGPMLSEADFLAMRAKQGRQGQ